MAYRKTEHPGVSVYRRRLDGKVLWYAKWRDPATGKWHHQSLAALKFPTKTAALPWLREMSDRLALRKQQCAMGILPTQELTEAEKAAKKKKSTPLGEVLTAYIESFGQGRPEYLVSDIRTRLRPWTQWAAQQKDRYPSGESLDTTALVEFRDHIDSLKKRRAVRTGRRGESALSKRPLSQNAKDAYRRAAMTFLNWARQRGFLLLRRDEISDALPRFKVERTLPEVLKPADYRGLLAALANRDAQKFRASREAKHLYTSKIKTNEGAQRHRPLFPLVTLLALTGMRLGEALHLKWDDVDFDRQELLVRSDTATGWKVKTRSERKVPLEDSPALTRLLQSLALRRGENRYVIEGDDPTQPKNFSRPAWNELVKAAGLDWVTPQVLRQSFATSAAYAKDGPPPYDLARRMGHDIAVAQKFYVGHAKGQQGNTVEDWLGVREDLERALGKLGFTADSASGTLDAHNMA